MSRRSLMWGSLVISMSLLGCGTAVEPPASAEPGRSRQGFGPTDVMFLQMMVPHHRQGIAIAELAEHRTVHREVRLLAKAIGATQGDEVRTMAGWLREWGQPATAPAEAHAAHGGMPATDQGSIEAVAKLRDAEFERAFLNLLIAHQDDAVQLARRELGGGRDPDVRRFARQVERSRAAQIRQLVAVLDGS
jgi:uncharacterized protein (DUF305 family)